MLRRASVVYFTSLIKTFFGQHRVLHLRSRFLRLAPTGTSGDFSVPRDNSSSHFHPAAACWY